MNSHITDQFRKLIANLPEAVREKAKEAYRRFQDNPYHTSLHFKQVHSSEPIFSIRIGIDYRALGLVRGNDIYWYWIGSHSVYDRILSQMHRQ